MMMAAAVVIWVSCLAVYDVGVQAEDAAVLTNRIANLDRLERRQSGVTVGAALFVAGAIFLAMGFRPK